MRKGTPTCPNFNNEKYAWKPDVDYRKHPELYRIGKGEQGVLICEPYKSEIGQNWRFKTEVIAVESSDKIYVQFLDYLASNDFVGADMARKYLQMGYTRARRHANYKGGRKYDAENKYALLERGTGEEVKAKAAAIFYAKWKAAEHHQTYAAMKTDWKKTRG